MSVWWASQLGLAKLVLKEWVSLTVSGSFQLQKKDTHFLETPLAKCEAGPVLAGQVLPECPGGSVHSMCSSLALPPRFSPEIFPSAVLTTGKVPPVLCWLARWWKSGLPHWLLLPKLRLRIRRHCGLWEKSQSERNLGCFLLQRER